MKISHHSLCLSLDAEEDDHYCNGQHLPHKQHNAKGNVGKALRQILHIVNLQHKSLEIDLYHVHVNTEQSTTVPMSEDHLQNC